MTAIFSDLQFLGMLFAALLGLVFGSFLNVCLARLPEGESVVLPASHCRKCDHSLAWWENLPLLSWLILRGRCRRCRAWIGLRYPLVELAVGMLWAGIWLRYREPIVSGQFGEDFTQFRGCWGEIEPPAHGPAYCLTSLIGFAILSWMLVALAALDAEHFWLPDWLTLPGIALGFAFTVLRSIWTVSEINHRPGPSSTAWNSLLAVALAAGVVLIIRLGYWLVRRKEGMGLGDAKLMAMLGAWLGLAGALDCFVLAVLGATLAALLWLAALAVRRKTENWGQMPLPLGTFLCVAALTEIFCKDWLWLWWRHTFLNF